VAEGHWSLGRRVVVEDIRRDDTFMRVTWHAESNVFVVSHWRGEVCVAATRIPPEAAPDLINLLVKGLAESASASPIAGPLARPTTRIRRLLDAVRGWRDFGYRRRPRLDGAVAVEVEDRRSA
jgi:hypothetical protein